MTPPNTPTHGLGPYAVTVDGAGFQDVAVVVGALCILQQGDTIICLPAKRTADLVAALSGQGHLQQSELTADELFLIVMEAWGKPVTSSNLDAAKRLIAAHSRISSALSDGEVKA